jgi:hypothetical protein
MHVQAVEEDKEKKNERDFIALKMTKSRSVSLNAYIVVWTVWGQITALIYSTIQSQSIINFQIRRPRH